MSYYYVSRYQEQISGTAGAAGSIVMPAGIQAITLLRRDGASPLFESRLLDPQLYLAEIPCATCSDVCSKLIGYPWFLSKNLAPYDSDQFTQPEYLKQIQSTLPTIWGGLPQTDEEVDAAADAAVEFQIRAGCEYVILPSPLTIDYGTSYARELQWLDSGLRAVRKLAPEARVLATVALSDTCTYSIPPEKSALLEVILDHVSAREPAGVYIVVEQRVDDGYYLKSANTVRTILKLVSEFKASGLEQVLVCYVGTAGLMSLAAGADAWASGWYRGERRVKIADLPDDNTGRAQPAFYSHALAGEIHPKDLDRLRAAALLDTVEEPTRWSEGLFRALRAGKKTKDVAEWTNNAARAHFNEVMIRESNALAAMDTAARVGSVKAWLAKAQGRAATVRELGELNDRTSVEHQSIWRETFDRWAMPTNDDTNRTHSGV